MNQIYYFLSKCVVVESYKDQKDLNLHFPSKVSQLISVKNLDLRCHINSVHNI